MAPLLFDAYGQPWSSTEEADPLWDEGPSCFICGCTEDAACPGGCCWIEDPAGLMRDICSACEEKARTS